jgi:hypothetical protein
MRPMTTRPPMMAARSRRTETISVTRASTFGISPIVPSSPKYEGRKRTAVRNAELCRLLAAQGRYVIRYDNRDCGLSTKHHDTHHGAREQRSTEDDLLPRIHPHGRPGVTALRAALGLRRDIATTGRAGLEVQCLRFGGHGDQDTAEQHVGVKTPIPRCTSRFPDWTMETPMQESPASVRDCGMAEALHRLGHEPVLGRLVGRNRERRNDGQQMGGPGLPVAGLRSSGPEQRGGQPQRSPRRLPILA